MLNVATCHDHFDFIEYRVTRKVGCTIQIINFVLNINYTD